MVRTTITIPTSMKERMSHLDVNWSEIIREMIGQKIEEGGRTDMAEAVILNERVKRPAQKGWNSVDVIRQWRRKATL